MSLLETDKDNPKRNGYVMAIPSFGNMQINEGSEAADALFLLPKAQ
jgi:hypothetical protein